MLSDRFRRTLFVLGLWLWPMGCYPTVGFTAQAPADAAADAAEQPVTIVPLKGKITKRSAELSGLAWYGDHLVLLPQYPHRFAEGDTGSILAIPKERILAFLDGDRDSPIKPIRIAFDDGGLAGRIEGFEGFEAIAFDGDQAYLTIEARRWTTMVGYIVAGRMEADLSVLRLDPDSAREIPSQSGLGNISDETIVLTSDAVLTVHEANGARVNARPVASVFDRTLQAVSVMPFPTIEYRVTDATAVDSQGRFWAINYFYPKDRRKLQPAVDALSAPYGLGPSHARSETIERLVEFQVTAQGIVQTDSPPLQLELGADPRNWEGVVRLGDRGFLLVTDTHPDTILAFVPKP